MITGRDITIIKHVEEFGYITLKQVVKIAYNNINFGYDYARRRMSVLKKQGSIKSNYSLILGCNVYYIDERYKNPSLHKNLSLNYYCNLIGMGAEIEYFKQEEKWLAKTKKECISDAVCVYRIGNARFHNLIEVNLSNNKLNLSRFEAAIDEYRVKFNTNTIPTLILIDDTVHKEYDTKLNVIRLDYDLKNISEVLI